MKTRAFGILGFSLLGLAGCLADAGDGSDEEIIEQTGAIVGYSRIVQETPLDATAVKDLTVSCPTGTVAYGAGYAALSSADALLRTELRTFAPSTNGRSWHVRAQTLLRGGAQWKLQVTLGCAPKLDGYKVVVADAVVGTGSKQGVSPTCSAQKLPSVVTVGGGFAAFDASNKAIDADLVTFGTNGGWWTIAARSLTAGASWKLRGFAICANKAAMPGYHLNLTEVPYPLTTTPQTVKAYCDIGQRALAAGVRLLTENNTDNEVHGLSSMPITGGWTTTGLFAPSGQKVQASRALQQQLICVN